MTEAEKVISSFIELLDNNDSVLNPIVQQMEQMKQELSRLSSDKDKAMLIQEYCKPHPRLKETLKAMAERANLKDFKYKSVNQPSYDLERAMNTFLKPEDNQETKPKSSEDKEPTKDDNE
jgi:hypothetical protein